MNQTIRSKDVEKWCQKNNMKLVSKTVIDVCEKYKTLSSKEYRNCIKFQRGY